jgi:hypothetical protein
VITANEGSAVGLACGSYMATGQPSLVYLQVNFCFKRQLEQILLEFRILV